MATKQSFVFWALDNTDPETLLHRLAMRAEHASSGSSLEAS
jgi:hypothetical protein